MNPNDFLCLIIIYIFLQTSTHSYTRSWSLPENPPQRSEAISSFSEQGRRPPNLIGHQGFSVLTIGTRSMQFEELMTFQNLVLSWKT